MSSHDDSDPTDGNYGPTQRAAELIEHRYGDILNAWLEAIIEQVPSAKRQGRAELADHLVALLDNLVFALKSLKISDTSATSAEINLGHSAMHGRERATLKGYTTQQLAQEHFILRRVLVRICREQGMNDVLVVDAISHITEQGCLAAIEEFSESMQSLQQKLMGTLIHDVRTPLGVAANYVELLSLAGATQEQKERAVRTVGKSLRRASEMLEDLLDSVKLDAGQGLLMRFNRTDTVEALCNVCMEARNIYSKEILTRLPEHPVTGIFDEALVVRTVENLISNAVKFGHQHTPITVSLDDYADHVVIRVHNLGNPIPTSRMHRIFEFFSTQSAHHGQTKSWGLGLSLIKTVAENHGGKVELESSEKQGTTFGMVLLKHFRKDGEEQSILL